MFLNSAATQHSNKILLFNKAINGKNSAEKFERIWFNMSF